MKLRGDAREVYKRLLSRLESMIKLGEARTFLKKFEPTSDREEIIKRQNYLKEGLKNVRDDLEEYLLSIRPIRFRREFFHDRILLVSDEEVEEAEKLDLCPVTSDPSEIEDYPLILSTIGYGIEVEVKPSHIAPELYIIPLWENRDVLEALSKVFPGGAADKILISLKEIEEIFKKMEILENLDEIIVEKEKELNRKIEEKLERFKLTLSGRDLVEFMKALRAGNLEYLFHKFSALNDEIIEEINKAEKEISDVLGISVEIFPRDFPVEVPPEQIEALKRELEREFKIEFYLKSRETVEKILPHLQKLKEEIQKAYELYFLLVVKKFTRDFVFPEIVEEGIGFIEGRNLFIENPQPVSYFVGKSYGNFPGVEEANIVILTGANSGGKTSLLELISQIVILAHMGFPVPAKKAWFTVLDEIFFFKRKRSVYGAGAFETSLKGLVRAIKGKGKKLILIDEFESITEPGAAAKILAELLKIAYEKGFFVVIVSHLGEDLKREIPFARVDGIEAKGLDENLNLIVDRQPKFGVIGRSTPELIVERLARKGRGEEKMIMNRILKKFRK
ncbi:DNA mismatch repair protein [Pyrococcus furiosus DSM 3638]|uniref:DNA-binding protein MutS2 n=3 Tax=Pyrococcus furiosus TaxID=2261 RepID=MUTS2_PYRFU|nr:MULTISPECIES: DNA mismatch repair protein [Pyrococcus]Q8U3J2.1 RecName: Full=DNA-binding protein MutS2 [Pyrococcus furiosus DSM 3638]AAL80598.1 DNA mismatch repair protein [Pyrococcus furiosus DSM 3638]AFN03268.1 DNA mismatch repair protein [Pyrococcus furiosus COM1]MDK2869349.1 mismatch repair protein MutS2 [Pyrococcus sp.]QEK78187.1 DNA mismatch repair protein [Pyrococcus furiosus DSM 3638]